MNIITCVLCVTFWYCVLTAGFCTNIIRPGIDKPSLALSVETPANYGVPEGLLSRVSTDFDGDQIPDLAFISGKESQSYLFLQLSSRPRLEWLDSTGSKFWLVLEGRDVNDDHLMDLVLTGISPSIPAAIYLGDGNGNFTSVDPWNFFGSSPLNHQSLTLPDSGTTDLAALTTDSPQHFDNSFLAFGTPFHRVCQAAFCEDLNRRWCFTTSQCSPRSPPAFPKKSTV